MDNHSTKGKSGLIREWMAKGLGVRRAEKAVYPANLCPIQCPPDVASELFLR
jgi:hypothetical protein